MKMRDMMWIYGVFILLSSEAWTLDLGTYQSSAVNRNNSSSTRYVVRNSTFKPGRDVNLTCSDKTWNETIFVVWNIQLTYKQCRIAFAMDGESDDSCNDGKRLQNTSSSLSSLHIPKFSSKDVGVYECEAVYRGGVDNYEIHVAATVPPKISGWFKDTKNNTTVAFCRAEGGKPAANISWSHAGNSSSVVESNPDGSFTVESRLVLSEKIAPGNLRCSISHQHWDEDEIVLLTRQKADYLTWLFVVSGVLIIIVVIAGLLFFAQKKLLMLRRCQRSDTFSSKSPPIEDVEEVEPYASYIQRVNSIYN